MGLGLVLLSPPDVLHGVRVSWLTAFTGTLVSLAGVGWSLTVTRIGGKDVADALQPGSAPSSATATGLDDVTWWCSPTVDLARLAHAGDQEVVDFYRACSPAMGGPEAATVAPRE